MTRLMLTDEHWSKLRTIMRQHGIYNKPKLRKIVEGILYRMRVGCPWRDLPSMVMTVKSFARAFVENIQYQLFQEKIIQK